MIDSNGAGRPVTSFTVVPQGVRSYVKGTTAPPEVRPGECGYDFAGDLADLDAEICRPEGPPQTARGGAERCGACRLGVRPGCAGERERTFPT